MSDSDEDNSTSYTSDKIESKKEGESSINVMEIIFSQKEIEGSVPIANKPNPPLKEEEEEMVSKMIYPTLSPK